MPLHSIASIPEEGLWRLGVGGPRSESVTRAATAAADGAGEVVLGSPPSLPAAYTGASPALPQRPVYLTSDADADRSSARQPDPDHGALHAHPPAPSSPMSGAARSARAPPVLAARPSAADDRGNDSDRSRKSSSHRAGGTRQKRTLIESACSACRGRKSRCDGERPTCSRCRTLHTDCAYEAEEGESRWSALRRRNKLLETERTELRELITYLQTSPEPEARDIFQRIRSGGPDHVFALLRQIREGHAPNEMHHMAQKQSSQQPWQPPPFTQHASGSVEITPSSNASVQQRLPPISTMFAVSGSYEPSPLSTPLLSGNPNFQEPSSARSRGSRPSISSYHSLSSGSRGSGGSNSSMEMDHDHPFRP
ncbi:hypothetical protein LTR53_002058 [Teratosphaeriaceae sp. CCFEE 6253]|nr:hypothetical protein LTR53_002058 [Teratosphaeriaceae sp. CCFEE 6253]